METQYAVGVLHVLICLFGVCVAAFLVCWYADNGMTMWDDETESEVEFDDLRIL